MNATPSIIHAPMSLNTGQNRFGMVTPNKSIIKCENAAIATPVTVSVLKMVNMFFKPSLQTNTFDIIFFVYCIFNQDLHNFLFDRLILYLDPWLSFYFLVHPFELCIPRHTLIHQVLMLLDV